MLEKIKFTTYLKLPCKSSSDFNFGFLQLLLSKHVAKLKRVYQALQSLQLRK